MCIGQGPLGPSFIFGKGKNRDNTSLAPAPAPIATSVPPPSPVPTPTEVSSSADDRKKRLARLRGGLNSTIKTSARGITGGGADLVGAGLTGKDKLGS